VILVLPYAVSADTPPPIPTRLYGTLTVNGSAAAVGTAVEVRYGTNPATHTGGTVAASIITGTAGQYGYGLEQLLPSWIGAANGDLMDVFVTPPGPSCPQVYGGTAAFNSGVNVQLNLSVTAICGYTLTYTAGANGTISGTSPQNVAPGGNGTQVTAVPNAHYHFLNWSDGVQTASRTDTNVQNNITATANFAIDTVTLTYTAGANGSITGSASQTINYGANGTQVTAVPNAHYHFLNWSDGLLTASRTDTSVVSNLSVTANFAIDTVTLTYTAGANGSITGAASQTINYGGNGSAVTAVADSGFHFVNWSDGLTGTTRQDNGVTASISVTANFEANPIGTHLPGAVLSIPLKAGWNTFSIPIKPETNMDTWGEFIAINDLSVEIVYAYDPVLKWVQVNTQNGDALTVLDGYYVKMVTAGSADIIPSANQSTQPVKPLSIGLNLVGVASLVDVDVASLLTTVSGYDLVHNPPVNGAGNWNNNIFIKGNSLVPTAKVGLAYWVNIQTPGNMVGFTSTPLP